MKYIKLALSIHTLLIDMQLVVQTSSRLTEKGDFD